MKFEEEFDEIKGLLLLRMKDGDPSGEGTMMPCQCCDGCERQMLLLYERSGESVFN